jgi:hypothetical protein
MSYAATMAILMGKMMINIDKLWDFGVLYGTLFSDKPK